MKSNKDTKHKEPIYLSTGIKELDEILAMDVDLSKKNVRGGFLIGEKAPGKELDTPIILINGGTGTGKTTLILQIAFQTASDGCKWMPVFCALEQSVSSLERMASSFNNFQDVGIPKGQVSLCNLASSGVKEIKISQEEPKIFMCLLAPRPITEGGDEDLFQVRLDQLNHIIKTINRNLPDPEIMPVFFLDSINVFSRDLLTRNQIYRLFSLFRNNHIPAVLTLEHHWNYDLSVESDCVQNAKFLADIVISLTKESSSGYQKYYLEIDKSRVSPQALGRHLYKIRTNQIADKIFHDPRTGIVLYPSIHSVLSKARDETAKGGGEYFVSKDDKDLDKIIQNKDVKLGECFSIIGPPGTHKLALGMNLSMGHEENKPPSLLVVNFGGSGDIKFNGVAWTTSRQYCKRLKKVTRDDFGRKVKFWYAKYKCKTKCDKEEKIGDTWVTILTFKIGALTPEECFFVIDKVIEESDSNPFSSVLLSDTAELCNGFPLLASDPLFLPALIDLFATRNLVTVCIGVEEGLSPKNADINFSLSSRADYRIVLSHYPNIYNLSKNIVEPILSPSKYEGRTQLKEQLVSLVVDNVTGKHYGRELRWLYVTTNEEGGDKTLHCDISPEKLLKSLYGSGSGAKKKTPEGIPDHPRMSSG
jgi:KaiC/GvpD/RAD55 family RecA-like ATPase